MVLAAGWALSLFGFRLLCEKSDILLDLSWRGPLGGERLAARFERHQRLDAVDASSFLIGECATELFFRGSRNFGTACSESLAQALIGGVVLAKELAEDAHLSSPKVTPFWPLKPDTRPLAHLAFDDS